jgi:hypothetical protein
MEDKSIFSIPSHGQSNDPSAPSVLTPQADPFNKMWPFPTSLNPGTDRIAELPRK